MVLWTNLHGGFFVGIFLIGCYGAGELATWLVEKDRDLAKAALLRSRPYLATAAACAAVTLVNPYSYHLHEHIWRYLGSPGLYGLINEFQGTNFQSPQALYFEPIVLLGVLAAAWSLYHKRFADAFLVAAWVHLGLVFGAQHADLPAGRHAGGRPHASRAARPAGGGAAGRLGRQHDA